MKLRGSSAAVSLVALACIIARPVAAQLVQDDVLLYHDSKAKDLFVAAHIAITGGPGGLARLKSMRLKGRSKFVGADGAPFEGSVEVRILLPDSYLRIDSGAFGRRLSGYTRTTPLDLIEASDKTVVAEPKDPLTLNSRRTELARLMLGMAWVSREVPVKLYTRDTPVDVPRTAEPLGLDAVGDQFAARVLFDPRSRLPVRVLYWTADRTVMTITFLDRRSTGGYSVPSHIVTTAGDRIVDELTCDEIAVNPPLGKADFTK